MPAEDIRHPEKQPTVFEGGRKNIKDKKRDKRGRDRAPSGKGVLKTEKFPNTRKHSHCRVCESLGSTEGNITGRKNK